MGFIDDNKHFLFHSLTRNSKGLSDNEKNKNYGGIRFEIRQRLKDSYLKCRNKDVFFQEALETLSFYESDYLILNLFFEYNPATIINYLYQKEHFKNLIFKKADSISRIYYLHIYSVFHHKKIYRTEDDLLFLKSTFSNIVEGVSIHDWNAKNELENSNPLISKYSKWILQNLKSDVNLDKVIHSFVLFVKIWNYFNDLSTFNRKAILFYSNIISEYEKNLSVKEIEVLYRFIFKLGDIFSDLFVEIAYIPLLDKKESKDYKPGYLIKRQEFFNKFKKAEKLFSMSKIDSIYSLFQHIKGAEEENTIERAKSMLNGKLDNYEFPKYEELIEISKMELNKNAEKVRRHLFLKLYLFEFI